MDSSPDDEFDRKYDLLKHEIDRAEDLRKSFQGANNTSSSNINIHAGGIGVIVSSVCCAFMFLMCLFGAYIIGQQNDEIRELKTINREFQYQFNAIYSRAPYLKENQNARHSDNP